MKSMAHLLCRSTIMSNLWAGDLHILKSIANNLGTPDIQSRRKISGKTTRNSATHYYDVLGVNSNATHSQIKSAFYNLSKLHHPDVTACTKSHAIFTEVNEAYEIIGNVKRRRMYDKGIFIYRDARTDSSVDKEDDDYTKAYRERTSFQRGNRPPPPTGRSKIYNYDEFYRQHYNDLRERRAQDYKEYVQYQEMMRERMYPPTDDRFVGIIVGLVCIFLLAGFMMVRENDYDRDRLSKSLKK